MVRALRLEGSILFKATVTPHAVRGPHTGVRIGIASPFEVPVEPRRKPQFIGMHDCLCITLRRPSRLTTVFDIDEDLPILPIFGRTHWFGSVKVVRTSYPRKGKRIELYIARRVWHPFPTPLDATLDTTGVIHRFKAGKGLFTYYVMEFPGFQKNRVSAAYVTKRL